MRRVKYIIALTIAAPIVLLGFLLHWVLPQLFGLKPGWVRNK
jgi:hypothetical protein